MYPNEVNSPQRGTFQALSANGQPCKALIADDHPFIRSSVRVLLETQGFDVVGLTSNGVECVQLARQHHPDLIVLDIGMPGLDGLEVINRIKTAGISTRILILTSQSPLFYSQRCMKAGAAGFICKTEDMDELIRAVKAIMAGYMFFPNMAINSVRSSDAGLSEVDMIQRLSDRELTILQQLARGMSNKDIAEAMLLSSKTISTYKTRLIEKLSMKSVVYLADFARRNDLI